jgi:hypothetical protein
LATGMSSPAGFVLAGMLTGGLGYRGDAAGDIDFSEKVVVGDSAPFCVCLDALQPKKEEKPFPPAGDLGLLACIESGDVLAYGSSSMKSSVTPSNCNLRFGCCCRGSEGYNGIFGMVGDRVCSQSPLSRLRGIGAEDESCWQICHASIRSEKQCWACYTRGNSCGGRMRSLGRNRSAVSSHAVVFPSCQYCVGLLSRERGRTYSSKFLGTKSSSSALSGGDSTVSRRVGAGSGGELIE